MHIDRRTHKYGHMESAMAYKVQFPTCRMLQVYQWQVDFNDFKIKNVDVGATGRFIPFPIAICRM